MMRQGVIILLVLVVMGLYARCGCALLNELLCAQLSAWETGIVHTIYPDDLGSHCLVHAASLPHMTEKVALCCHHRGCMNWIYSVILLVHRKVHDGL